MNEPTQETKYRVLITTTMRIGGEEFEHSTYYRPGSGDLKEVFEIIRLAFERAMEKEKNEAG